MGKSLWPLLVLFPSGAWALTLTLQSETTPLPGVTLRDYRTSSPATNTWVAFIDLCANHIHVDATRAPASVQSTGGWAQDWGVQVATNGDFYAGGPLHVYGDAVGGGVPWPLVQTGRHNDYAGEWFFERYGWIAFLEDGVEWNHTEWVKNNASTWGGLQEGWQNGDVAPAPPGDVIALVSGFPELVVEGNRITCPSATDSSCFPDRSDMRSRHPRTAMGLTQDRGTLILAVVDGRTSSSAGMYGTELASLMDQVGAWQAWNLDGGGSSQLWVEGDGYINDIDGNNNGNGTRSVANHWGVFAGAASGSRERPGHCAALPPCAMIPAGGGVLDDAGPCFKKFGDPTWWRAEAAGHDGHLWWTNAWESPSPDNWGWWRVHVEEPGEYLVETWSTVGFSVWDDVHHLIRASGVAHDVQVDPTGGSGWKPVGTFTFDGLGDEYIAVHDAEATAPGSEQHIAFDAIQLSRVGAWCGNGTCDGDEDCGDCAQDCTGPAELPGNGVDDDCNGEVDEEDPTPEPTPGDDDATADDDSAGDDDSARGRQPPIEGRRRAEVVPAAACGSCSPAALPLVGLPLGWTRRRRAAVR